MRRGEVWWAELAGDAGFRPVVIVSCIDPTGARRNVTIAEGTRVMRRIPSEVPLTSADGMPTDCAINADNLHTIPMDRLRARIVALSDAQEFALARALRYSLGLEW